MVRPAARPVGRGSRHSQHQPGGRTLSNGSATAVERDGAFDVGDAVVSVHHGPGTVTARGVAARGVRPFTGRGVGPFEQARREYLTVELQRRGITLIVPVDGAARTGLRRLSSPAEARRALDTLAGEPEPLAEGWRQRQKEVSERLGSGDLLALAGVVRDLTHAARLRGPPASDRELCEKARGLLEAELVAVLGDSAPADIERRLLERSPASR